MQTVLAGIAAGASLLGLVYAFFARRAARKSSGWSNILAAHWGFAPTFGAGIALVAFLFTLPVKPPWQHGLEMGWGIAIGAVFALWSVGEAAVDAGAETWASRCVSLLCLSALAPSLILLIFRADPPAALTGCAIGGISVILGCLGVFAASAAASDQSATAILNRGLESYILSSVSIIGASSIAILRFPRPTPSSLAGGYWAVPGLLTAVCALVLVVLSAGKGARLSPARFLTTGVVCVFGAAITAWVLHWKLLPVLPWLPCIYAAIGFALIGWVLLLHDSNDEALQPARPVVPALAAACGAILIGALAYQGLGGAFGQAIAVATAAVIVMLVHGARVSQRGALTGGLLAGAVGLIALFVWYRIYAEHAESWRSLDFQQHYQFLAIALGTGATFASLAVASGGAQVRERVRIWRTIAMGLAAVAAPLLVAALWGERAVAAYMGGLATAAIVWMLLAAWSTGADRLTAQAGSPLVYLLGSALVAVHVTGPVIGLELTRSQKTTVIAILAVIALAAFVADKVRGLRDETAS